MNTATKVGSPIKCGQSSNEVIICIINSFEPKTQTAVMLSFFFLFCQICMMPMGGDFLGVVISTALVLNVESCFLKGRDGSKSSLFQTVDGLMGCTA